MAITTDRSSKMYWWKPDAKWDIIHLVKQRLFMTLALDLWASDSFLIDKVYIHSTDFSYLWAFSQGLLD